MKTLETVWTEVTEDFYNYYFKNNLDLNYFYEYQPDGKEAYIAFIAKSIQVKVYVMRRQMLVAGKEQRYFINEALIEEFDCETF